MPKNSKQLTRSERNKIKQQFKHFTQFSSETIELIWEHRLTQMDMIVYFYFSLIDPFGDKWVEIPPIENVLSYLQISKSSFYKAIGNLTKLKFIDFESRHAKFKNLCPQKKTQAQVHVGGIESTSAELSPQKKTQAQVHVGGIESTEKNSSSSPRRRN